jgi:hypothetical protein
VAAATDVASACKREASNLCCSYFRAYACHLSLSNRDMGAVAVKALREPNARAG